MVKSKPPMITSARGRCNSEPAWAISPIGNTPKTVVKVVINIGLGEAIQDPKALESADKDLATISGQHPIITRARRSIAAFKLRTGMPIGMKVTLRGRSSSLGRRSRSGKKPWALIARMWREASRAWRCSFRLRATTRGRSRSFGRRSRSGERPWALVTRTWRFASVIWLCS